jgi:hypothetical protein
MRNSGGAPRGIGHGRDDRGGEQVNAQAYLGRLSR